MDYTTLSRVTEILGAESRDDDALVGRMISEASRWIDRFCCGKVGVDNYFARETITDEITSGFVDGAGVVLCHPMKPKVWTVSAVAVKESPGDVWHELSVINAQVSGDYSVLVESGFGVPRARIWAKLSYEGGFWETTEEMAGDLMNAADLMAVRFYREAKSSLSDSIGVAELGTLMYTKAIPARVSQMLQPYRRWVP